MSERFKTITVQILGAAIGVTLIYIGWLQLKAWYIGQPLTGLWATVATMDRLLPGGIVLIFVWAIYGLNLKNSNIAPQPMVTLSRMYTDRPLPALTAAMILLWLAGYALKAYGGPLWLVIASQIAFGIISIVFGVILGMRGLAALRRMWEQRQTRQS